MNFSVPPINNGGKIILNSPLLQYNPNFQHSQAQFQQQQIQQQQQLLANYHQHHHHHPFLLNAEGAAAAAAAHAKGQFGGTGNQNAQKFVELSQESSLNYKGDIAATPDNNNNNGIPAKPKDIVQVSSSSSSQNHLPHLNGFAQRYMAEMELVRRRFMQQEHQQQLHHHQISSNNGGGAENPFTAVNLTQVSVPPITNNYLVDKRDRTSLVPTPARLIEEQPSLTPAPADTRLKPAIHIKNSLVDANFLPNPTPLQQPPSTPYHPQPQPSYLAMNPYMAAAAAAAAALYHHPGIMMPPSHLTGGPAAAAAQFLSATSNQQQHATNDPNRRENLPYFTAPESISSAPLRSSSNNSLHKNMSKSSNKITNHNSCVVATGAENEDLLSPSFNPSSHNKISTTTFIPPPPQNNDNHHQGGYYAVPADIQQQQQQSMMAFAAAAAAAQRQYLQQHQQQQQHFLMNNLMAAAVAAGGGGGRRPLTPVPNGTGITGSSNTSPNLHLNHSQQQLQQHNNFPSNNALTAPQDPAGLFLPPYNAGANGSFVTPQAYMAAFAAAAAAAATPSGIFPLNPHHPFGGFPYPVAAAAQPPFSPYFGPGYYFPTPTNGSSLPHGFSATNHHPILPPSQQQLTYDDNNYGVPLGGLMGGGSGVWNHPSTPFLPHHHAHPAASMLPIPNPLLSGANGCGEASFDGLNYIPGITSLASEAVGDHQNLTAASIATPTMTNKRKSSSSNVLEENGAFRRYSPPPLTPTISSHHSKVQYTTPTTAVAATKPGVGGNKRGAAVSAFNDNVHPFFAIPPFAPPLFSVQVRTSCGSGAGNGCNNNSFFTPSSNHIPLHHHHLTSTSNTLACPPATATAVSSSVKKQRNASPRQPRNSVDSSNKRPIDATAATTPLSNILPSSFKTPKRRSRTPLQNECLHSPNLFNKQPSPLIKNMSNTSSYTTPNNNNTILDLSSPTMISAGGVGVKASCSRPASVATTPRAAVAKQQQRNTPLSNCSTPSTTNLYPNTGVGTTTNNCTNATLKNCKEPAELQLRNSPQQQQPPFIPVHTNRFASAKKLIIEEIHRLDTYLDMLESRLGLLNRAKTDMSSELNCRLTGNPSSSNNSGSVESLNRKNFSSLHVKLAHAQRKLYELSGHLVKDTVYSHNREISHKSHIQISSKYQPSQSQLLPSSSQDKNASSSSSLPTSSSQSADVASIPINNNKLVNRNTVNQAEISEKCIERLNDLDPRTDQWTLHARAALSSRISLVKRLSHGKYRRFEQTYRDKFETWYESVTKSKKIAKRRNRDAKAREFFENQYPELRDDRLERERLRRIWTRNTCGNYARTETDVEEISKRLLEQEEEKKRLYNLSAAIPVMLSVREKELERRTVFIDPLKVVPTVKHFSFTCPRYREFKRPMPLPNNVVNFESDNKVIVVEPTHEINNNVLTSISPPPPPLPSTAANTRCNNDIVVSAVSAAPKDLVYDFTENEEIIPQISTTTEQQLPDNNKLIAPVPPDTTLTSSVPTTADNEEEKENRILDDEHETPCCPNHDKEECSILLPLELRRIRNAHYNPWTPEEHDTFKKSYTAHPKEFDFISRDIGSKKNVQDCVLHYYRTKKEENYKKMVARRKIANKKRKINNNNNSNHSHNPNTNILNNNVNISCSINNNKITINCNSTNNNSIIPCIVASSAGRQSPSLVATIRTRNSPRLLPPAPTLLLIHQNNNTTTTNEESNDGTDSNSNFNIVTSSSSSNLVIKFSEQSIIQPSSSSCKDKDDKISADNMTTNEPKPASNHIFSNLSEQLPASCLLNTTVVENTCSSHSTTTAAVLSSLKISTENGGSSSQYLVGSLQQAIISTTINLLHNSSPYTSTMPQQHQQCQEPSSKQNQFLIPPSSTTYQINQSLLLSASTCSSKEFPDIQMDQEIEPLVVVDKTLKLITCPTNEPKINNNLSTSIKNCCSTQTTTPLSLPPLGPCFTPTLMPVSSAISTTTTAVFEPTNVGYGRLTYSSPLSATTSAFACPPPVKLSINNSFLPSSVTITAAANSTANSCSLGGCGSTITSIIYNPQSGVSPGSSNSSFFTNFNNLSSLSTTTNSNVSSHNGFRTISNSIKSLSFPNPTHLHYHHHNNNNSEKRLKLDIVTTSCSPSSSTNEKPPQLIFVSSTARPDLIYNATAPNSNNNNDDNTSTNPAIQAFLSALPKDGTKSIPIHQRFTAGIGNEDNNTLFHRERCNDVSNGTNNKILNNEDPSSIQHMNRSFIGNTTGSGPRFPPGVGVFSELSGDALLGAVIAHQINQNVSDAESIELWNPLKHTI